FTEFVSGFFRRFSPNVEIKQVKYKNHTIMLATGKEQSLTIGYVNFNNLLVFGVGDRAAKACIDVVTKNRQSLGEDPLYIKTKAQFLPGADAVSFANFEAFVSLLKNQMLKLTSSADTKNAHIYQEQFDRTFRRLKGFQ